MFKRNLRKALFSVLGTVAFYGYISAEHLVILHTNDTHSTIDPTPEGLGGVLQRKVIIDSVKNAEKNVILIDAGDVVQGTTYFKYFNGDVEYPLMDMMGYEVRVLGNHEFDNGIESLAGYYKNMKGVPLSINYDFSGTELEGVLQPYLIKEYGGKKIGFFGVNIDPSSIIATKNFEGTYKEILPLANETADMLKNQKGCDFVVAVTHIGYEKINEKTTDVEIAQSSKNIDLIIGGHTHTLINPLDPESVPSIISNAEGKPVRVVQTGKQGKFVGKVTVDLDLLPNINGEDINYELIPVTDRFEASKFDAEMIDFLQPFRNAVDSINNVVIGFSEYDLPKERLGGLANLTADIGFRIGQEIADSLRHAGDNIGNVDMAIMNVGGIRHHMAKGKITEGQILSTYPFANRIVLIEVAGKDIIEAMRVSAAKGGEAVSGNVRVVTDENGVLKRVVVNNKEMQPEKIYLVATIDYIAEGNDDLVSLANHKKVYEGEDEISVPILNWIKQQQKLGLKVAPDLNPRFVVEVEEIN